MKTAFLCCAARVPCMAKGREDGDSSTVKRVFIMCRRRGDAQTAYCERLAGGALGDERVQRVERVELRRDARLCQGRCAGDADCGQLDADVGQSRRDVLRASGVGSGSGLMGCVYGEEHVSMLGSRGADISRTSVQTVKWHTEQLRTLVSALAGVR